MISAQLTTSHDPTPSSTMAVCIMMVSRSKFQQCRLWPCGLQHLRHNLHSAQTLSAGAWQGDRRLLNTHPCLFTEDGPFPCGTVDGMAWHVWDGMAWHVCGSRGYDLACVGQWRARLCMRGPAEGMARHVWASRGHGMACGWPSAPGAAHQHATPSITSDLHGIIIYVLNLCTVVSCISAVVSSFPLKWMCGY